MRTEILRRAILALALFAAPGAAAQTVLRIGVAVETRALDPHLHAGTNSAQALRHVSVVRYDAFGDLGGRFSFSAALLDDAGDGLVLTSIHGRTETRTYLKGISAGVADIELSPEETQAVTLAKGGSA